MISHICRGGTTNLTNHLKALQKANFKSLETEQGKVLRVTLLPEQNLYRSCQSLFPGDAFVLFIVKLGFLLPRRILFSSKFTVYSKLIRVKGIVHNFFVHRSNLIFWIVMGCGIADFGQRGLYTPFLGFHFVPRDLDSSPGPLITRDLDSRRRGPGLAEQ